MLEKHHIIYESEWDLTRRTENSSGISSTFLTHGRDLTKFIWCMRGMKRSV